MSHALYDFLAHSELFDEKFLNSHNDVIGSIIPTLQKYIGHCIKESKSLTEEIKEGSHGGIKTLENPFGQLIDNVTHKSLMSQSILQDLIILPDPLFSFCISLQNRKNNSAHSEFLGLTPPDESESLRKICRYMKDMTPFVAFDVVKFFPDLTKINSEEGIPFYYSPTRFAEHFEENVLQWIHQKAKIYPMKKTEVGLLVEKREATKPCRSIYIEFEESDGQCSNFYNLFEQKVLSFDEKTKLAKVVMTLPEAPPSKEYFDSWVFQSINQTARRCLYQIKKDAFYAHQFDARFSPQNEFIQKLTTHAFSLDHRNVIDDAVNPITFGIETPDSMSPEEFLKIRSDAGSLLSFRTYLNNKLNNLSELKNADEVAALSREIHQELQRKHIPELKLNLSNLYKKEALKWTAVAASMGVGVMTQGGSVAALICFGLAAGGLQTTKDNIDKLKTMPGFFWNRISKK